MMRLQVLHCLLGLLALSGGTSLEARVAQNLHRYGFHALHQRGSESSPYSNDSSVNHVYNSTFNGVTWDARNWRVSSTKLDQQGHYQSRASLANGYFGINVASAGPFFELDTAVNGDVISGWPLFSRRQSFAGLAGFWDTQPKTNGTNFPWLLQYGYESVISGIPHWSGLILDLGDDVYLDATVDNSTIYNFRTTYDYKAGLLTWSYTWEPQASHGSFEITYSIFVNKLDINQAAVRMTIAASKNTKARLVNVLEGYAAVRTSFVESGEDDDLTVYSAVRPSGISNVTAYVYAVLDASPSVNLSSASLVKQDRPYIYSNESTIAQAVELNLQKESVITVTKFIGVASTDGFSDPKAVAREAALNGKRRGYADALRSHSSEWASIMPDDSVDDFSYENGTLPDDPFILDASVMAVVSPFYLLQNTIGPKALLKVNNASVNDNSISVGGLTSDSYGGMIFWDADTWMHPGLAAAFPLSARRIPNYRVTHYEQAKRNVKTAYQSSQNETYFSDDAALYPWTSGRWGNCTATGPCFDYEYHLNGDIATSLVNEWMASGDDVTFKDQYLPIYNSIATAYADLLKKNGSYWTLLNMTDPDEYANAVDAGAYTMALISQTLRYANTFRDEYGVKENETWSEMSENVLFTRENDVTLEYTTMNNSVQVKQADVVLNTYPLDYTSNYNSSEALSDLDYYALKQSPDGPAMTYAIFSIVANEVSPSGCSSYTYAQYSYSPYLRGPFYQLSEQLTDDYSTNGGTHPAFPFLTGHGGANQVVLFGYLGLRYLPTDQIHIDPNLPPQIPQLKYRSFYWRGWPISASSNSSHTTIARATTIEPLLTADKRYRNSTIQVIVGKSGDTKTYKLPANGTKVIVENRRNGFTNTVPGNLVQCQPAKSSNGFVPGQFPISINDGAASTKWQPAYANNVSAVTIALPKDNLSKKISGFSFDWAQAPPSKAIVILHEKAFDNTSAVNLAYLVASQRNSSDTVAINISVTVGEPWTAKDKSNYVIGLQAGNSTNITFSESVEAKRFATLFIEGNQALSEVDKRYRNGSGATVAEWVIL